MTNNSFGTWANIADALKSGLVDCEVKGEELLVRLPVLYPGGTGAVVRISKGMEGKYSVTDFGNAFQFAKNIFSEKSFEITVDALAKRAGLHFNGNAVMYGGASSDQLIGVVSAVANISTVACHEVFAKVQAKKADDDQVNLVRKLNKLYGEKRVSTHVDIKGYAVKWQFLAKVAGESHASLIDYVKPHHNSVVNASAKFHDLALLENAPSLIAVVHSKDEMGDMLGLLAQTSRIIESSSDDKALDRAIN